MSAQKQQQGNARADDLTRARQYQGVDASGYQRKPQSSGEADGKNHEAVPGNQGEAGGRWHDHEGPYAAGRETVEAGVATAPGDAPAQEDAGFQESATGLYPDPATGHAGYGPGGREGHDAQNVVKPVNADAKAKPKSQSQSQARSSAGASEKASREGAQPAKRGGS